MCARVVPVCDRRKKGLYGTGPYAEESWSLQAYQKRVYGVRIPRCVNSYS